MSDYGRALIVGENTFGKGTVQQHRPLRRPFDWFDKELGNIQYTMAKFYRIDGGSTQHRGVKPDIAFPTTIDPTESGESVEPNALPWDKISAAQYQKVGNFSDLLTSLESQHAARIAKDPEFAYINQDIAWYQKEKARKTVSLNEQVRIKERDDLDARNLQRTNERLARMGKPAVKKLADVPTDTQFPDAYLQEAAAITADLSASSKH